MVRPLLPANVVAWNCKVGRRKSFRSELDRLPAASVYAFNEADGHYADLADWAEDKGLRRLEASGGIALFVGQRVEVIASGVDVVKARWVGPKGKRFRSRPIVWGLLKIDDRGLYLEVQHAPWNPVKNSRAWRAYQQRLRDLGEWFPSVDLLIVGDTNQSWAKRVAWAIRGTANKIRGRYVPTGSSIDFGIFRPGKKPLWDVKGIEGAELGSDHAYVTYRLTPRSTR